MTANATSAIPPTIADAHASCGVSVGPALVVEVHRRLDLQAPQPERAGLARRPPAAAQLERVDRQRPAAAACGSR